MNSDETLEQPTQTDLNRILEAINNLQKDVEKKFEDLQKDVETKFENVDKRFQRLEEHLRLQFMSVDARFDQMESIGLEAKSIPLMSRSQLTILTEEVRAWSREVHDLQLKI